MSVTADITPGPACGIDELNAALATARVTFIEDPAPLLELAQKLADEKFSLRKAVIARGREPRPGRDGFFEPDFHVGIQPGHIDQSGAMNFFDRELLKPFIAGQYIGQLHDPVNGSPGRRVDGTEIKVPPVRASKLNPGPGVTRSPDGRMHAARSGVLVYMPEQSIDVVQVHVHARDVDMRSGNLNMEGALTVQGSVQHQFIVRATGNIEINGNVECGSVFAGGSLRIRGGVRGGESGAVCAESDLSLNHAEGAYIRSGGALKLDSAINCDLAAHDLHITRLIRGGSASAERSLVVMEAGAANAGTGTVLAAGLPLERPVCDVHLMLAAQKEQRNLRHSGGLRATDERTKGGKAGRAGAAVAQKALAVKAELAAQREALSAGASVQILGRAHPGVLIQIGVHSLLLDETCTATRFSWDPQKREIRRERSSR